MALTPASSAVTASGDIELAYVQFVANVTVTSTTATSPDDVVSAGAVTYDGLTRVCIEFYCPTISTATQSSCILQLYEDSTRLGIIGQGGIEDTSNANDLGATLVRKFMTPASGSKTYSIKAYKTAGTSIVVAGDGAAGNYQPGYIRITSVDSV